MKSLRGHLLAASPRLPDPNFYRTVVLMVHHDEDGAVGLVLNRPLKLTVAQLWEMIGQGPCEVNDPVQLGGPVGGPLVAIHSQARCSEREILPGIHFAARKEHLEYIVRHPEHPFRIFNGYSGWTTGQLESEIRAGGWLTAEAREEHIFDTGDNLWEKVTREFGRRITAPLLRRTGAPADPAMN